MGKMVYLLMLVIASQIGLLVVFGTSSSSSLLQLFLTPNTQWDSLGLSNVINIAIAGIAAASLIIGTLIYKSDFLVLAGMAGVLYDFGRGLANVWQQACSSFAPYMTTTNTCTGVVPQLAASLLISPLILLYIFVVIEWWRGRD